jgi:hypothetical protein
MIGHNQISLDAVVEETMARGLYLMQLTCITRAVRDPRLGSRHLQVLGQIVERTNAKTGIAYPGRARLAADIVYYANGEAKRYSEATIAKTISELADCGYIVSERRAPDGKGRALACYTTVVPSNEDLQKEIATWCEAFKARPKRVFPTVVGTADVDDSGNVDTNINVSREPPQVAPEHAENRSDVDDRGNVRPDDGDAGGNVDTVINLISEVDAGVLADVDAGIQQELVLGTGSKREGSKDPSQSKSGSRDPDELTGEAAQAVWLYNETAKRAGFPVVKVLRFNPNRRKMLNARLKDAGGLLGWREALAKLEASPWCRGQNRSGWIAHFDFLLQPSSFSKLLSGLYDPRTPQPRQQATYTKQETDDDRARRELLAAITAPLDHKEAAQ